MSTEELIHGAAVLAARPAWHKAAISLRVDYGDKRAVSDMAEALDRAAASRGFVINEVVRVERNDVSALYVRALTEMAQ